MNDDVGKACVNIFSRDCFQLLDVETKITPRLAMYSWPHVCAYRCNLFAIIQLTICQNTFGFPRRHLSHVSTTGSDFGRICAVMMSGCRTHLSKKHSFTLLHEVGQPLRVRHRCSARRSSGIRRHRRELTPIRIRFGRCNRRAVLVASRRFFRAIYTPLVAWRRR